MIPNLKNFAVGVVATAPSPPTSGTSVILGAGQGARMPETPFQGTLFPAPSASDPFPTPANAEIVTVSNVATDTLTIARAQEGSTARSVVAGDILAATVTALVLANVASGDSIVVTQSSHAFVVGDVLKLTGADTYAKAQADSIANAEVAGVVAAVVDSNNFVLTTGGDITGLSGLTAGQPHWLSPTTAGAFTATEPSGIGQVSKPILLARTTTAATLLNMRGAIVSAAEADTDLFLYMIAR